MKQELSIAQQEHFAKYGVPENLTDVFVGFGLLVQDIFTETELLGFCWSIERVANSDMMTGMLTMRFASRPRTSIPIQSRFDGTLFHLGRGGYSSWGSPWQPVGQLFEKLNEGIPWEQKIPLETYTFSIEIDRNKFPKIKEAEVMNKIADRPQEDTHDLIWERPAIKKMDNENMSAIHNLRREMGLKEIKWDPR